MKFIKENYQKFYGNVEHESSYGKPGKIVTLIPEHRQGGSVLDLGAGDGRHSLFLASKGFDVKAVDVSEAGLEKLKRFAAAEQLDIKTLVEDLAAWSIDGSYDVMVATSILQHLPTGQAMRLLRDMQTHTNPEGLNAISLFTKNSERYNLDREEDPEAFYPEEGWLKDFYKDWDILDHQTYEAELIGKTHPDGSPMKNLMERILARKPQL